MKRLALILCLLAGPLAAVEPSEMLDDPALEARAREISEGLRCPVCQNESIDASGAPIAHDLRVLVRERLVKGDTNAETVRFIVDRYGEYVLLNPRVTGSTWVLWLAGPVLLILGGVGALIYVRRRGGAPTDERLTEAEAERLQSIVERESR